MATFKCTCGNASSDALWPAAHEARVVAECAWDDWQDYSGDRKKRVFDAEIPTRRLIECRYCGRVWIETKPGSRLYAAFLPDSDRLRIYDDPRRS